MGEGLQKKRRVGTETGYMELIIEQKGVELHRR